VPLSRSSGIEANVHYPHLLEQFIRYKADDVRPKKGNSVFRARARRQHTSCPFARTGNSAHPVSTGSDFKCTPLLGIECDLSHIR
jgi:hypothetical protein